MLAPDIVEHSTGLRKLLTVLRDRRTKTDITGIDSQSAQWWLKFLGDLLPNQIARAEIALSEQLGATLYPSLLGARLVGGMIADYGTSAASLLNSFTNSRSTLLREARHILGNQIVDLSPPLILAYAVSSADNIRGFVRAVEDLRNDKATNRLKQLVGRLAKAEPAEQIEAAHLLRQEFGRLFSAADAGRLKMAEVARSVPSLLTGNFLGRLIAVALGTATLADVIAGVRFRRHLVLFQKLHRRVPSAHGFYYDLKRVFGDLRFNEAQLAAWLANPSLIHLRNDHVPLPHRDMGERQRNASARRALKAVLRDIKTAKHTR
jgi:hypothetical protein